MFPACFACDSQRRECRILKEFLCDIKGVCPFFKTKEQFIDDAVNSALILERKKKGDF